MRGCVVFSKEGAYLPTKVDFPASRPSRRWAKRTSHHSSPARPKRKPKQKPLLINSYNQFIQTFGQFRAQVPKLRTYGWEFEVVETMAEELRKAVDEEIVKNLISGMTNQELIASAPRLFGASVPELIAGVDH